MLYDMCFACFLFYLEENHTITVIRSTHQRTASTTSQFSRASKSENYGVRSTSGFDTACCKFVPLCMVHSSNKFDHSLVVAVVYSCS